MFLHRGVALGGLFFDCPLYQKLAGALGPTDVAAIPQARFPLEHNARSVSEGPSHVSAGLSHPRHSYAPSFFANRCSTP